MARKCVYMWSFIMFLTTTFLFSVALAKESKNVPTHIRQLVFEKSRFSQQITLSLPCEDDPNAKNWVVEQWHEKDKYLFIPPLHVSKADGISEEILSFLTLTGLSKVQKMTFGSGTEYKTTYNFFSYSNKIKQHIVKGNFQHKENEIFCNFNILLGRRAFKSIDYTNQYVANPMGVKINFFALTFTYTLTTAKLPGLPKITKQFQGKAKAYLDPDDGKWKLDDLSLADGGEKEYLTLLREKINTVKKEIKDGRAYEKNGEYDKAIANYNKALSIMPEAVLVYYHRGNIYLKKEQYDKAIVDYNKAIAIDPTDAVAYNSRGIAYRKKAQYDKALEDFNKAITIRPTYYGPYFGRARIYSLRNDVSSACDSLSKAYENAVDDKVKLYMKEKLKDDSDFVKIRNSNCVGEIINKTERLETKTTSEREQNEEADKSERDSSST